MGGFENCCRPTDALNPFSKKVIYIEDTNQPKTCKIKIFDLENIKFFESQISLKIINNLNGISQININNYLYLCGTNENTTADSYLFKIDINTNPLQPNILINSIFRHIYPSLILNNGENLLVIGGKDQLECEYFQISNTKWKQLPDLPEKRFKCTLFSDENNSIVYLFGGLFEENKNSKNILRINMNLPDKWEEIQVKDSNNLLERSCSAALMMEGSENIYILGGKNNDDEDTEYIVEYCTTRKIAKKFEIAMKKTCSFELQGIVELGREKFCIFDKDYYIHTIQRNGFKMNSIKFDEFYQYKQH